MRKDIVLPTLAVAGGGAGFLLRRLELATAVDPETELFAAGAPVSLALLALILALALVFLLLGRGGKPLADYPAAFSCPSPLYMTLVTAAAFLLLASAALGVMEFMSSLAQWRASQGQTHRTPLPLAQLLCALLCAAAGGAALLLGKGNYRAHTSQAFRPLSTLPAYAGLPWLIGVYQLHSRDPILLRVLYQLLAVSLLLLALYFIAAFSYGHPHPAACTFCCGWGVVLGLTSLADGQSRFYTLVTLSFVLYALANLYALLRSRFGPAWPNRMPAGAEDTDRH